MSAEGLLDGSSSDNSQARRACCAIVVREKRGQRKKEREICIIRREKERKREESFGLGRTRTPYKENLMGQLNRYYRVESTSGSLTFDPLLSDVNLIIFARCGRILCLN